jgi:hypothetical protein
MDQMRPMVRPRPSCRLDISGEKLIVRLVHSTNDNIEAVLPPRFGLYPRQQSALDNCSRAINRASCFVEFNRTESRFPSSAGHYIILCNEDDGSGERGEHGRLQRGAGL